MPPQYLHGDKRRYWHILHSSQPIYGLMSITQKNDLY